MSTEKDKNETVDNTLLLLWKVHQFQAFQLDCFILIWVFIFKSWVFVRRVVIFIDYTLQHLVSQKKSHKSLHRLPSNTWITEKIESLRIEKNFVACCLYVTFSSFPVLLYQFFSLMQDVFQKHNMRNKNQLKV